MRRTGDRPFPSRRSFPTLYEADNARYATATQDQDKLNANAGNPRGLPEHQLVDVANDPAEQKDLIATQTEVANKLTADMTALQSHAESVAVESTGTSIDAASEERLRALGYVH